MHSYCYFNNYSAKCWFCFYVNLFCIYISPNAYVIPPHSHACILLLTFPYIAYPNRKIPSLLVTTFFS